MNSATAGRTATGVGGPRVAHPEINVTMDDLPAMHEALATMREEGPVVEVRCNGERAWIVLTYEALRDALRDEETFPSAASYSRTTDPATGRTLNSMQGDEHTRNPRSCRQPFRRQRMAALPPEVLEPVCHRVVDRFAGASPVDLRTVLTHCLPMEVITRLLGLPAEDSDALERWSNALFTYPFDPDGALAAKAEFTAFLEPVMQQRREEPGDDLVSTLVRGEFQGRRLDDEEILSFLRLLFPAGTHNTTNTIGNLFFALLERPELLATAAKTSTRATGRSRRPCAGSRRSGNLPRRARAEGAAFHGVELPPDAPMVYSFAAAGRDPAMFPDPDRFDLDRRPQEMLTFGLGEHFCLGAWLGRQEMRVALDVVSSAPATSSSSTSRPRAHAADRSAVRKPFPCPSSGESEHGAWIFPFPSTSARSATGSSSSCRSGSSRASRRCTRGGSPAIPVPPSWPSCAPRPRPRASGRSGTRSRWVAAACRSSITSTSTRSSVSRSPRSGCSAPARCRTP